MNNNVQLLRLLGLPVFFNADELASIIHIDSNLLYKLIRFNYRFYKSYQIEKSSGGLREIRQPSSNMKAVQAWILRNILEKLSISDHATAFIKGKGLLANVKPHMDNRYFLCLDIEDFYPSISYGRVKDLFSLIGYNKSSADILTKLCTLGSIGLPQGGVTSPYISNLIASSLDRRLSGYTSKRNIIYTRYADDMTFSSNNRDVLNKSIVIIKEIIESERFIPHPKKMRIMGPKTCCHVTGLIKNSSEASFGIGKKKKHQMRRIMHQLISGVAIDTKYSTEESLVGWLAFLHSVDHKSCGQMSKYWEALKSKYNI